MTSSPPPPGPSGGRGRPGLPLLSSLPARELEDLLVRSGGTPSQARSAAGRVIAHVMRRLDAPPWDGAALSELGIGAWAHPALLSLEVEPALEIIERAGTDDGTERLVLRARDGAIIETVIIPGPGRTTVCISSQVGCARACTFCETGRLGLTRQLDAGEIVDQVRIARALWGQRSPALSNVVFMGMGEPFDNLSEVARATDVLTDHKGLALPRSRVTVSTVGVADKIGTFFRTCRAELAVSLNAPDDARRDAIMPVNRRFALSELLETLRAELPKGRKVLFEYVLIGGFNDAEADADKLAELVAPVRCRVNVIPLNPGSDPSLRTPDQEVVDRFVARLASRGVVTLVRRPRGRAASGACGQLVSHLRKQPVSRFGPESGTLPPT